MLTQARLKELLAYDPETGIFTRLVKTANTVAIGEPAGSLQNTGYIATSVDGKKYLNHRLAFLWMLGSMPNMVDHINCVRSDNRWANLRSCTNSQNMFNQTRETKHVYKNGKAWLVRLTVDKKDLCLGTYQDKELAELVAAEARDLYHKDFQRKEAINATSSH